MATFSSIIKYIRDAIRKKSKKYQKPQKGKYEDYVKKVHERKAMERSRKEDKATKEEWAMTERVKAEKKKKKPEFKLGSPEGLKNVSEDTSDMKGLGTSAYRRNIDRAEKWRKKYGIKW